MTAVLAMIDDLLRQTAGGREVYSADEVQTMLLDLRNVTTHVAEPEVVTN